MSKSKLSYMGSRRLITIAKHAAEVQFKTSDGIRIEKRSYAFYRGSEWIRFSYLEGNKTYRGKIYVNHGSYLVNVRIHLDVEQEDEFTGNCESYQVLNNSLNYDKNFNPVPPPKALESDVYHNQEYFVYDIRKEAVNS